MAIQTEKTSKPLKAAQAVTVLGALGAVAGGVMRGGQEGLWIGGVGLAAALGAMLVIKLIAWWQYG